jgi:hypothetical protein
LACSLTEGVSAGSHSQEDLKKLVGHELEQYRNARQIKAPLDEKHRCWRLDYADELSFHMDIVPCIPEEETQRRSLAVVMESYGMDRGLASSVSELAVGITDDRHLLYTVTPSDWMISNPEGYAKWFESRMKERFEKRAFAEAAQVDDVPIYRRKTPLQRVVQLLKRHRDQMFESKPDSKPISVIITTLAARSYTGGDSVEGALKEVLTGLNQFVNSSGDVVPNPVNPEENFADRWHMPKYAHLQLKQNFGNWVNAAIRDFQLLLENDDTSVLSDSMGPNFGINLSQDRVGTLLGITAAVTAITHAVASQPVDLPPSKPWINED